MFEVSLKASCMFLSLLRAIYESFYYCVALCSDVVWSRYRNRVLDYLFVYMFPIAMRRYCWNREIATTLNWFDFIKSNLWIFLLLCCAVCWCSEELLRNVYWISYPCICYLLRWGFTAKGAKVQRKLYQFEFSKCNL